MKSSLLGLLMGGATGGAMLAVDAITSASTIGLQEAVGAAVFVCGLVWWLGRKFQSIEDRLSSIEEKVNHKHR